MDVMLRLFFQIGTFLVQYPQQCSFGIACLELYLLRPRALVRELGVGPKSLLPGLQPHTCSILVHAVNAHRGDQARDVDLVWVHKAAAGAMSV